ncbi:MAG: methionyl-tRNA formyltransferase [Acidobacteria bacterium]|nr:methionyl-tRNA formyltransferase [Acidobacteriota bacterium]
MKIVFAGSPLFALHTLERLAAAGHDIRAVVTQPDRPTGRRQQLEAPPVKEAARKLGLAVFQPEKIKGEDSRAFFGEIQPEAVVVVGYGQILPPWLLELPRFGCINLHASLLPAYRGAAPIQWAVVRGETKTGVTTMQMDPGLDTGPVLLQWETGIGAEETSVSLGKRLSVAGADLMIETLKGLEKGTLIARPQDNSLASRAPLLKKDDGRIDWSLSAQEIFNRVRGLLPWPGAHTVFRGKKLQVWRAKPNSAESADSAVSCGQLLAEQDRVSVACGGGTSLQLLELQMEGKRRVVAADFIHGARPQAGELLFS